MAQAVSIVSTSRRAGPTEEIAVFAAGALLVSGALPDAIGEADRWVVVISAGESLWAGTIGTWVWIFAARRLADQTVRSAVGLFTAWGRRLADAVGTVRARRALTGTTAGPRGLTATVDTFTFPCLATCHIVTVAVSGAVT